MRYHHTASVHATPPWIGSAPEQRGLRGSGLRQRAGGAGGAFDPLSLASDNSPRTSKLREAEIKHGRLAMVAFLGAPSPATLVPPPWLPRALPGGCPFSAQIGHTLSIHTATHAALNERLFDIQNLCNMSVGSVCHACHVQQRPEGAAARYSSSLCTQRVRPCMWCRRLRRAGLLHGRGRARLAGKVCE